MSQAIDIPIRPPKLQLITPEAAIAPSRGRPLIGLALMVALLPLRSNWGVDLVLLGLAFTVPGVLALRAVRVASRRVIEYPIYVPAAATLVLMTAGLACDLIGPLLGIDHPLHGVATALTTVLVSLALWLAGRRAPEAARLPWAQILDRPLELAPLALPALSALGALLLSNGHGATVARISAIADVIAFLACLLAADKLGRRRIVMLIFSVALAAEWSWSLRGQEIIGFDISTEIFVAQHTQAMGIWHAVHHNDAYGAMLSITVLPSVLRALTGISPLIAFKALYPVFSAMLPVSIYLVGDRILSRRFAIGAAGLLLSQNYFFQQLPELARQEVALMFFAAMIAALAESGMRGRSKQPLVVAMALGVVVSHYSSTYLAVPAIIIALLLHAAVARRRRLPLVSVPLVCAAIALTGGGALWNGVITRSASNATSFVSSLQEQGLQLLPGSGGLISSYLSGNTVQSAKSGQLERMAVDQYRRHAPYIDPRPQAASPRYALRAATAPEASVRVTPLFNLVNTDFLPLFNVALEVLFSLGAIVMLVRRRSSSLVAELAAPACGALAFLIFIRVSGTAAAQYNQTRALLQSLIVLAIPAAWLTELALARLRARRRGGIWVVSCLALGLVFAQQFGVFDLVFGGGTSLNLASSGEDFERFYVTPAELSGASWAGRQAAHAVLYADRYGQLRIFAVNGRAVLTSVTPRTLDRHAWIYGTDTNVRLGRARAQVNNSYATYRWPSNYIDTYYNTVYDNGDSKVYHGW
jgi:uncharacterized membrane protein